MPADGSKVMGGTTCSTHEPHTQTLCSGDRVLQCDPSWPPASTSLCWDCKHEATVSDSGDQPTGFTLSCRHGDSALKISQMKELRCQGVSG